MHRSFTTRVIVLSRKPMYNLCVKQLTLFDCMKHLSNLKRCWKSESIAIVILMDVKRIKDINVALFFCQTTGFTVASILNVSGKLIRLDAAVIMPYWHMGLSATDANHIIYVDIKICFLSIFKCLFDVFTLYSQL